MAAVGGAAVVGIVAWILLPIPASMLARDAGEGVTIEDRNGVVLRSTRSQDGSNARWMAYEGIDPDLINAFVAVEDRRFWDHHGIDVDAVARAVRDNLLARRVVSGASTITMQTARLMRPAGRNWGGKVMQVLWALRLERHLTKQQILEQYLNRVQLGQGTVGVAAASALYYGTSASELSIAQAATLAGLAHAPSRDNPHVSATRALARRGVALARMQRLGFATAEDIARAKDEPLAGGSKSAPFLAPHFTTRVLSWMVNEQAIAAPNTRASLTSTGLTTTVQTSIDVELQTTIESEVRHTVDVLRGRGVADAAVVVLDNASGEVLAWVGSPDFWATDNGQTDMVVNARQPGSALKPFLYGLAFDRGFTAATVLPDIPTSYATATGSYSPRNYDRRFRGPTRAREALASSYNVPAVGIAARVGASSLLRTLHLAGFESLGRDAEYYGLGLALGNGDVSLIELANGYRAIANGGEWRPWTWRATPRGAAMLTAVSSSSATDTRRVMSPMASAIVLDILQDPVARTPGFGVSTPFDFPFPVAVKTGTSRHFTDNWAVGVTRAFTVAVWAGNFSGRPMEGVSGVTGAGPLLHRAVMAVAARVSPNALATPAEVGAVPVRVCRLSGLRATPECPQMTEWFAPGTEPAREDDWERGGRVVLPDEYAEWAQQGMQPVAAGEALGTNRAGSAAGVAPDSVAADPAERAARATAVRDSVKAERAAVFRIASPLDGDRYAIPPGIEARYATIPLLASGPGAEGVRWTVDGKEYASGRWALAPGSHVIEARSALGQSAKARIVVER
jgi:penicillin-binding protein 1C